MPLPTPRKDEEKNDFISRCMGNDTMKKEYPDQKQRTAICYQQWRDKNKKGITLFPQIYGMGLWAILPEQLRVMADYFANYNASDFEAYRTQQVTKFKNIEGKIAVLPLHGVITPKPSILGMLFGGTSLDLFGAAFGDAMANKDVGAVLIDIDSPGGSIYGVHEMANRIFNARGKKPIVAMVNNVADSAAYWIAAAAEEIIMTPSGETGSIGVYGIHRDVSEADAKAGLKVTIISSTKYKTEDNPHAPLSDDAKATIQERINEIYGMMVADIAQGRGVSAEKVKTGFGEGRVFGAARAKATGMVDKIGTYDAVIKQLAPKPHRSKWAMRERRELIA